jgi:hypothetical protein
MSSEPVISVKNVGKSYHTLFLQQLDGDGSLQLVAIGYDYTYGI